jgi:hypothetical protein
MKLRHAAALAFIGWLLVLPSSQPPNRRMKLDSMRGPYKSQEQCLTAIRDGRKGIAKFDLALADWFAESQCVRRDDRLAPN